MKRITEHMFTLMQFLFHTRQNDRPIASCTGQVFVNGGNIKAEFLHSAENLQMWQKTSKRRPAAGRLLQAQSCTVF